MEDKDLKEINETLQQILLSLNESKEALQTILMAIYDIDTGADDSQTIEGLKAIFKLLKEISEKQRPKDNAKEVIYRTNGQ
jgi:hypothetical protein